MAGSVLLGGDERTVLGGLAAPAGDPGIGFQFVIPVPADGQSWTDIMTAFGTVSAVVAAVGIAS